MHARTNGRSAFNAALPIGDAASQAVVEQHVFRPIAAHTVLRHPQI
jgi:hypothetical protein